MCRNMIWTVCPVLIVVVLANPVLAGNAIGPRIGTAGNSDEMFIGAQGEFGPAFDAATLVPGIDFGLGDEPPTIINFDLRYYLIRLPETGLRFYCSAGPSLQVGDESDLGLSLALGLNIPMKSLRRYNVEYRWGFGDIPDHKIGIAVMFGL